MTRFTPAQAAQQHNRDAAGRYTEKLHTDPGDVLDARRWTPPSPRLPHWVYDTVGQEGPGDFADQLLQRAATYQDPRLHTSVDETFPNLPGARRAELVTALTTCELATTWMHTGGGDAAWEAQDWDARHPDTDPPMLLVDYRNPNFELVDGDDVGVDWEMVAEANAEAWVRRRHDLWRAAGNEHTAAVAAAAAATGRAENVVA